MIVSDIHESKPKPRFDDLMLAMDAVDTIRHESSLLEHELSGDDRRHALVARLREYYAAQGIEVSDEILDAAVDDLDKNRFVFEPLKPGLANFLATVYVRRISYGKRLAIAAAAIVATVLSSSFLHQEFVVKPRERAVLERQVALETTLPAALKDAHAEAVAAAKAYGDDAAIAVADNQKEAAAKLIDAGEAEKALDAIERLRVLGNDLRAKIAVATLMADAEKFSSAVMEGVMSGSAKAAMTPLVERMRKVAADGDERVYRNVKTSAEALATKIRTPLQLRIVDRSGTKSGVWRTNDGGSTKVYYIVVEALDPAGKAVTMDIKNVETGRTESVNHWGVRVPQSEYNRVGNDKQSDGIIDERDAGTKPAGTLDFEWTLPVVGNQMITRW